MKITQDKVAMVDNIDADLAEYKNHLGYYDSEEDAALSYNKFAMVNLLT